MKWMSTIANCMATVNKSKHSDLAKLSPFLFQKTATFTNPVFEALCVN